MRFAVFGELVAYQGYGAFKVVGGSTSASEKYMYAALATSSGYNQVKGKYLDEQLYIGHYVFCPGIGLCKVPLQYGGIHVDEGAESTSRNEKACKQQDKVQPQHLAEVGRQQPEGFGKGIEGIASFR